MFYKQPLKIVILYWCVKKSDAAKMSTASNLFYGKIEIGAGFLVDLVLVLPPWEGKGAVNLKIPPENPSILLPAVRQVADPSILRHPATQFPVLQEYIWQLQQPENL